MKTLSTGPKKRFWGFDVSPPSAGRGLPINFFTQYAVPLKDSLLVKRLFGYWYLS
jgi:hypothetical protein